MHRFQLRAVLAGVAAGASAIFFLDPKSGARRRALVCDQFRHQSSVLPRYVVRGTRAAAGPLRGALHGIRGALATCQPEPAIDDAELKHRVESELGRHSNVPLGELNIDAADGIVRIRGTAPHAQTAESIVNETAKVHGVRAVISLMRMSDGTPVGGMAGDIALIDARPRAELRAEAVREALMQRWPLLTDADILATEGHVGKLCDRICSETGAAREAVRVELEGILLAAV
jgi:hypothetical protein